MEINFAVVQNRNDWSGCKAVKLWWIKPCLGFLLCCLPFLTKAQFSPPAGSPGSIAISAQSTAIQRWADKVTVNRGMRNIALPDSGYATAGIDSSAKGPALENGVVSLGDGGSAVAYFATPISNKSGYDFAIFENAFHDSFLELAFVEVSSDGHKFVRFPAISLTDTAQQTGSFGTTNCAKLKNLAGSFRAGFGTPFDLEELKDSVVIDLHQIHYVKIIDVVGSIDRKYASRDSKGNKINDPWPTNFPSSGFDLDAIAVLDNAQTNQNNVNTKNSISIFPNPAAVKDRISIHSNVSIDNAVLRIIDLNGRNLSANLYQWNSKSMQLKIQTTGMFLLEWTIGGTRFIQRLAVY